MWERWCRFFFFAFAFAFAFVFAFAFLHHFFFFFLTILFFLSIFSPSPLSFFQGDILVHFMNVPLKLFGFRETVLGRFSFHTGMLSSHSLTLFQRDIDEV